MGPKRWFGKKYVDPVQESQLTVDDVTLPSPCTYENMHLKKKHGRFCRFKKSCAKTLNTVRKKLTSCTRNVTCCMRDSSSEDAAVEYVAVDQPTDATVEEVVLGLDLSHGESNISSIEHTKVKMGNRDAVIGPCPVTAIVHREQTPITTYFPMFDSNSDLLIKSKGFRSETSEVSDIDLSSANEKRTYRLRVIDPNLSQTRSKSFIESHDEDPASKPETIEKDISSSKGFNGTDLELPILKEDDETVPKTEEHNRFEGLTDPFKDLRDSEDLESNPKTKFTYYDRNCEVSDGQEQSIDTDIKEISNPDEPPNFICDFVPSEINSEAASNPEEMLSHISTSKAFNGEDLKLLELKNDWKITVPKTHGLCRQEHIEEHNGIEGLTDSFENVRDLGYYDTNEDTYVKETFNPNSFDDTEKLKLVCDPSEIDTAKKELGLSDPLYNGVPFSYSHTSRNDTDYFKQLLKLKSFKIKPETDACMQHMQQLKDSTTMGHLKELLHTIHPGEETIIQVYAVPDNIVYDLNAIGLVASGQENLVGAVGLPVPEDLTSGPAPQVVSVLQISLGAAIPEIENEVVVIAEELNARLGTYESWPGTHPPMALAMAGFCYTGNADCVVCRECDGSLENFCPNDVPIEEHALLFPYCPFVRRVLGNVRIERILVGTDGAECLRFLRQLFQSVAGMTCLERLIASDGIRAYNVVRRAAERLWNTGLNEETIETGQLWREIQQLRHESDEGHVNQHSINPSGLQGPRNPGPQAVFAIDTDHTDNQSQANLRAVTDTENNLTTFSSWRGDTYMPMALARAGFYYTGNGSWVYCRDCGSSYDCINANDSPEEEHAMLSPNCPFVRSVLAGNLRITSDAVTEDDGPCHRCLVRQIRMMFLPCGHRVCCKNCAPAQRTCSVCREPIIGLY